MWSAAKPPPSLGASTVGSAPPSAPFVAQGAPAARVPSPSRGRPNATTPNRVPPAGGLGGRFAGGGTPGRRPVGVSPSRVPPGNAASAVVPPQRAPPAAPNRTLPAAPPRPGPVTQLPQGAPRAAGAGGAFRPSGALGPPSQVMPPGTVRPSGQPRPASSPVSGRAVSPLRAGVLPVAATPQRAPQRRPGYDQSALGLLSSPKSSPVPERAQLPPPTPPPSTPPRTANVGGPNGLLSPPQVLLNVVPPQTPPPSHGIPTVANLMATPLSPPRACMPVPNCVVTCQTILPVACPQGTRPVVATPPMSPAPIVCTYAQQAPPSPQPVACQLVCQPQPVCQPVYQIQPPVVCQPQAPPLPPPPPPQVKVIQVVEAAYPEPAPVVALPPPPPPPATVVRTSVLPPPPSPPRQPVYTPSPAVVETVSWVEQAPPPPPVVALPPPAVVQTVIVETPGTTVTTTEYLPPPMPMPMMSFLRPIEERPSTIMDLRVLALQRDRTADMKTKHDMTRQERDFDFLRAHKELEDLRIRSELDAAALDREIKEHREEIERITSRQARAIDGLARMREERLLERRAEDHAARELEQHLTRLDDESERLRAGEMEGLYRKLREQTDMHTLLNAEQLRIETERRGNYARTIEMERELLRRVDELEQREALLEREWQDINSRRTHLENPLLPVPIPPPPL